MAEEDKELELNSSELGTKSYWDSHYEKEIENFKDHGDIGEVWFGEDSAEKMVDWLMDNVEGKDKKIIDLGCGNGHLLFELANVGYTNLVGIDYSLPAITLAKEIAAEKELEGSITFETADLIDHTYSNAHALQFDVILDKGTFDAISLNIEGGRKEYLESAHTMLSNDPSAVLLITSCNWVKDELIKQFSQYFKYHAHIKYPTFTFGGQTGQKICTVAFKKI